jgi:hypothetical protein
LFKNESFKKFAPYFLDQPRTIIKAEELSGVSRRTISEILESFTKNGEYDSNYVGWYGGSKGLKIKTKLFSDYFSKILNLSQEESKTVEELITQESIQKIIISKNVTLDMLIMKTFLLTMVLAVRNQMELDDPMHEERTKYFKQALLNAYKNAPPRLMKDIKTLLPKGSSIPVPFGLDSVKNEEIEPWLKTYMKNNQKTLQSILSKMRNSNFPIITSLSDMYDNFLQRIGGVLLIKRQFEVGNADWIQQHMAFRESLKPKRKNKKEGESK